MAPPTDRIFLLLCLISFCGCWKLTDAQPLAPWEDGLQLRRVRGIQSDESSDELWTDQNQEEVQNVFKRFLFHYSKARNSLGTLEQQPHSVHPLLRLSPKLSQRRKKKVLLVKIRALPEGI